MKKKKKIHWESYYTTVNAQNQKLNAQACYSTDLIDAKNWQYATLY